MTEENGIVNSPFSFEDCFLLPCVVVSTSAREWVTLGKFECLIGVYFVLGNVCTRKPWREGEERLSESWKFQFQIVTVSFSFKETEERASCWGSFWHAGLKKRHRLGTTFPPKAEHDTILGTTFPQKPNTTPFWEFIFPPKSPTWHRFGDHFPPKSPHDAVLGTKFPTLDRPSFFLFWFFSYFGLV